MTSHDVVNILRKITGIRKIGHAGTLDPFAEGLLIMAVSREATREINKYVKMDKKYIAKLYLGKESDTYDRTGEIKNGFRLKGRNDKAVIKPSQDEIEEAIRSFIGEIEQIPPMYSAKKINGKKLYELARKGVEIERKSQKISIFSIKIIKYEYPSLELEIHCSSGTYIRSLAHDIGRKLGTGAYLEELKRTQIGAFMLRDAAALNDITGENWARYSFS